MILSQCQNNALNAMLAWAEADDQSVFILSGAAGTGKSYLLTAFLDQLAAIEKFSEDLSIYSRICTDRITLTATTNNALSVLPYFYDDPKTVYSAFGIKLSTDRRTGQSVLDFHKAKTIYYPSDDRFNLIVIDEASMIDERTLDFVIRKSEKVLLICDLAQLTPVGLDKPVFAKRNYPTYDMKENQRSKDNPELIKLLNHYRDCILNDKPCYLLNSPAITKLSGSDFTKLFLEKVKGGDQARYLSNNNAAAIGCNNYVSKQLSGSVGFKAGDVGIVHNKPHESSLTAMEELTVVSTEEIELPNITGVFLGQSIILSGKNQRYEYFVPYDIAEANKQLKRLQALQLDPLHHVDEEYNTICQMSEWLDLRKIFGLTIRRSQGQSYDTVFLDVNTLKNLKRNPMQLTRLLYVALSRSRGQVYTTGDL